MSDISKTAFKILEALVQVDNNSHEVFNSLNDNYVVSCTNLYVWFEKSKNMLLNLKIKSSLLAEFSSLTTGGKYSEVECSEFKAYIQNFKECLLKIIDYYEKDEKETSNQIKSIGNKVFIIHGHDPENLLRLEKLIKERFKLDVVVLKDAPRTSRHLIQKLEEETSDVGFVFALFTPDDFTIKENEEYYEARPNVIFELGWFYAKLGGSRVSILLKEGTKIPSDIEGIDRIEFIKVINEELEQIEKVLKSANLIDD